MTRTRNGWPSIRRAQFALQRRQPLPPDVAEYLLQAFHDINDGTPPAKALGLSISKRARLQRDEHIRACAALMPPRWSVYQMADQMLLSAAALEAFTHASGDYQSWATGHGKQNCWQQSKQPHCPGSGNCRKLLQPAAALQKSPLTMKPCKSRNLQHDQSLWPTQVNQKPHAQHANDDNAK